MPQYVSLAQQGFYEPFNNMGKSLQYLGNVLTAAQARKDALAQQAKENQFKQGQLDIAKTAAGDVHAENALKLGEMTDTAGMNSAGRRFDPDSVIEDFKTPDGGYGVPRTTTHEVPNAGVGPAQPVGDTASTGSELVPSPSGGFGMVRRPVKVTAPTTPTPEGQGTTTYQEKSYEPIDPTGPLEAQPKEYRDALKEHYKANAPSGTPINSLTVNRAYRTHQIMKYGLPLGAPAGMYVKEAKVNPETGMFEPSFAASPFGTGAGVMTPEGLKMTQDIQGSIQGDDLMKGTWQMKPHVDALQAGVTDKGSLAPGVTDASVAQHYVSVIAPNARFNESSHELVGDTHSIPGKVKQAVIKAFTGGKLSDEQRLEMARTAAATFKFSSDAANEKTQPQRALGTSLGAPFIPAAPITRPGSISESGKPGSGDGSVPGSSGSGQAAHKFNSPAEADASGLPKGSIVNVYDPKQGVYRRYQL